MFKENFNEFFDSDEMANGIEGVRPVFTCAAKDVVNLGHEKTLVINDTKYKVAGVQPDGTGLTSLILEKQ